MKKLVCYVLTFCLLLQFSTVSVYAVESEKKTIEIYDYYEGTDKTVDLYFQNNDYYVVAKPTFCFKLNQCFAKNEPPFRSKLYQMA